jgi:MFS transporter, YNFM family, putative membrane transport protein
MGFTVLFALVGGYTFANVHMAGAPWFLGPAALGMVFATYLIGTVTTGRAAWLSLRLGRQASAAVWVAVALSGILLTLVPWLPAIVIGLGLLAAGVFPEQTLSLNFVTSAAPRARATAIGIYTTSYYLGGAAGGVLPAIIWHQAGWPGCVALVAALHLFVLAVALTCWRDNRPA